MNALTSPAAIEAKDEDNNMAEQPTTIRHAVCALMAELQRLKKADHNKFAHYDFTSVDDFKDAIRPRMAKHGLFHHTTQAGFQLVEVRGDKDKIQTLAQFDFDIVLKHVSGEEEPAERMTVLLPLTGAQTSGAARSYAIKEWFKSRFLASSGDTQEEADLMDQSREGMRLSKADARDLYQKLQKEMREVAKGNDHEALAAWWADNREQLNTLPKDWFLTIKNEYAESYVSLKAQADLDRMSDEELDRLASRDDIANHPITAG